MPTTVAIHHLRGSAGTSRELAPPLADPEQLWISPPAPPSGAPPEGDDERRRRRRRRVLLLSMIVVGLVVSGVLYVFLSYQFRSTPGAKSVRSAVSEFRGGRATATAHLRYAAPAQGVYELNGQGSEQISFPPNSQRDGAVMPASVRFLPDGCWRWHLDYNVAHWEEYDFCPTSTTLTQPANRNFQAWDFGTLQITNLATFNCPANTVVLPHNPTTGKTAEWTCQGTSTAVQGRTTARVAMRVVASTFLTIGNHHDVPAFHEVQTTTLSGPQTGTVVEDWWFSTVSGLPLRVDRQIRIATASPLGAITYTEHGTWKLTSLAPRR